MSYLATREATRIYQVSKYYAHDCSSEIFGKTSKNRDFGAQFALKWGQYGLQLKQTIFFLQKEQKQIISFQKLFILSKYNMFWLSYERFSILCDAVLRKSVISCHNSCGIFLDHPWKFHFFFTWSLENVHAISSITLEIPCPQPFPLTPHAYFMNTPGNFTFSNRPLEFPQFLSSIPLEIPCPQPTPHSFLSPVKIFSGTSHWHCSWYVLGSHLEQVTTVLLFSSSIFFIIFETLQCFSTDPINHK